MSTGKRLAKRSILGTRVCAPRYNGLYMCGVIQATKSDSDEHQQNVYSVYFDDKTVGEFHAQDLVGPGFNSVQDLLLCSGQTVFLTHNGREVRGQVLGHRPDRDEVELSLGAATSIKKRLEEVRLIESRKSARLQDSDTDYSRLAEGDYSNSYSRLPEPRRRASSLSIEVPYGVSGRKRRSSADDGVMDDCMAAMVLMSLSCSPKSPCVPNAGLYVPWGTAGLASSSGASSYSSGASGSTRATPSPPNHLLITATAIPQDYHHHHNHHLQQDEGIDVDDSDASSTFTGEDSYPAAKRKSPLRTKVVFQCTWPGCGRQYQECQDVEKHVRIMHLGREDSSMAESDEDHEEEFYYTEIEVDSYAVGQMEPPSPPLDSPDMDRVSTMPPAMASIYSSSVPTLSHLDMARPAHEDPEYRKQKMLGPASFIAAAAPITIPQLQKPTSWHLHGYAASAPCNMGSPQKCMRLSPKPLTSPNKTSPLHRRNRSESRKCRKVYGMENRDMWCTQCKWKKACTRFVD